MPKLPGTEGESGFYHVTIPLNNSDDGLLDKGGVNIRPISEQEAATLTELFQKIGRNQYCPCGSGRKFKKCCLLAAN